MTVELKPVKSSNIESVGHDPAKNELIVRFRGTRPENDRTYHYEGVDAAKHAALIGAESIGKHLNTEIIGKHKHRKG